MNRHYYIFYMVALLGCLPCSHAAETIRINFQAISLDSPLYGVFFGEDGPVLIPNGNFSAWQTAQVPIEQRELILYINVSAPDGTNHRKPLLKLPINLSMDNGDYRLLLSQRKEGWEAIVIDFSNANSEAGHICFINLTKNRIALQMGDARLLLEAGGKAIHKVSVDQGGLLPTLILRHKNGSYAPAYQNSFAFSEDSQGIFLIYNSPDNPSALQTKLIYAKQKKLETAESIKSTVLP